MNIRVCADRFAQTRIFVIYRESGTHGVNDSRQVSANAASPHRCGF